MIEQVALPDGSEAFVLPLLPSDRETLVAEFETLTPETRRRRFLAPVRHLSDTMLEHLVDDVDGIDHIALVLCVETSPDVYDPVALARIVRYEDARDAADLAVTVKDEWQGRGVATVLLRALLRNRPVGVERIVTEVFKNNPASLSMLRALGRTTEEDLGSGVCGVVVDLEPIDESIDRRVPAPTPATKSRGVALRKGPRLRDPVQRHAFHTRDQVCPWFR